MTSALLARLSIAAAGLLALAATAEAQDYGAMINQEMAAMNRNIAQGQQMVNGMVQQRMRDRQVQAGYRRYLAHTQAAGQPAMDFPTYTYNDLYTRGFSSDGVRAAQANEARNQAHEQAAWQDWQAAQQQRGAAQQAQQESHSRHQQEAGRSLMGQSSYVAPDGSTLVLPHTWQANTTQQYQGNTYHVDASGQYYVLAANGWWYPVAAQR